MTMDMLKQEFFKLNDSSKRTSIVVYADRSVPFDTVSQVMALAGSAGISGFIALGTPDVKRETRFEQR
jgi:biopolymer transport protein ExbD